MCCAGVGGGDGDAPKKLQTQKVYDFVAFWELCRFVVGCDDLPMCGRVVVREAWMARGIGKWGARPGAQSEDPITRFLCGPRGRRKGPLGPAGRKKRERAESRRKTGCRGVVTCEL